ncbi:hypothetical protein BC936DRAFT_143024 [Jimgerdemannia flammicorona]|uniref:Uncharacterized protein n=1 Tax=Jimgerdemannia flammicorona TaxID=994334 RepID=A0A432ZZG3_9FUNG|nr:hypothetical protein BC936DRAFT_143024 [Jimgerdemannia flammicorona]
MPIIALPFEYSAVIFVIFPKGDAVNHHLKRTDLFNCSLISRDWRAAALPLLWKYIKILCGEANEGYDLDDRIWNQLADSLVGERASASQDNIDRASHIRESTIHVWNRRTRYMVHPDTAIIRILQLFLPSQLQSIRLNLNTSNVDDRQSYLSVLQTIFPALSQRLKSLVFIDTERLPPPGPGPCRDFILQNLPKSLQVFLCYSSQSALATNSNNIFVLPELRSLELWDLEMTADPLDQGLRTWHRNFNNLAIVRSPNFSEARWCRLSPVVIRILRMLKLHAVWDNNSPDISEKSLCHLIDSCPHLEHLDLEYVTSLSDQFLAHCARHAGSLQSLEIKQSEVQFTGEGVTGGSDVLVSSCRSKRGIF